MKHLSFMGKRKFCRAPHTPRLSAKPGVGEASERHLFGKTASNVLTEERQVQ
jgi:hypothetical protein